MKLLPKSSFFFVLLLLIYSSCKKENNNNPKNIYKITFYDSISYHKSDAGKQDSAIYYTRKMLEIAKDEHDVTSEKEAYNKLAIYFKKNKNVDSSFHYINKFFALSKKTRDTLSMAKALYKKGWHYRRIDSLNLAKRNLMDSKNYYLQIDDSLKVSYNLLDIANIEKKQGNFGMSQFYSIQGLKYIENTSNARTTSKFYYTIAVAAKERGDLPTAEKRINQALALANDSISIKTIGHSNVISFYDTKANILKAKGNYTLASDIYENLLNNSLNLGKLSKGARVRVNGNLAHTLFLKSGFNERSDSLLKNSLYFYKKEDNTSGLISINMKLAELYSNRDETKAVSYLEKVIEQANILDNKKSLYEAYHKLIMINNSKENIAKYLVLEEVVRREKDSLESRFVNTKFDFDKSENERIKAENENIILENKATNRLVQNLILLLILISSFVIAYFIYQRIKRKHKIEKVKTVHVTEARISTKVHDELANDLYELMTQLETANPEKEVVLDKLDTIYNQARDISKQIQSVDTDKGFADELSNLFRTYQSNLVNVLLKRYDTDIWKGISEHIKITLYRVLQEFLTNMKKHSNASLVVVSIEKQHKQLFIQYIDNGKGFTTEISKNGLRNAENRIRAIKGKLTFDTELSKGCKFSINVPV